MMNVHSFIVHLMKQAVAHESLCHNKMCESLRCYEALSALLNPCNKKTGLDPNAHKQEEKSIACVL